MRIRTSGNVGIGTANPGVTLDVSGPQNITGDLNFQNASVQMYIKQAGSTGRSIAIPGTGGNSDWIFNNNVGFGVGVNTANGSLSIRESAMSLSRTAAGGYGGGTFFAYSSTSNARKYTFGNSANERGDEKGSSTALIAGQGGTISANYDGGNIYIDPGAHSTSGGTNGSVLIGTVNSGNVGIGITNPSFPLHIPSSGKAVIGQDVSVTGSNDYKLEVGGSQRFGSLDIDNTNSMMKWVSGSDFSFGTHYTTALFFLTTNIERMRISAGGNVGIGTANPNYLLHVLQTGSGDGQIQITNNSSSDRAILNANIGSSNTSLIQWGTTSASTLIGLPAAGLGSLSFGGGTAGGVIAVYSNNPLIFGTNNLERVRISASGNVGIGTTDPANKLDIADGSVNITVSSQADRATGFKVTGTSGSPLIVSNFGNSSNLFVGNSIGANVTGSLGYYNTIFGLDSGANISSSPNGYANSFFGYGAGRANTTGIGNVFIGNNAGRQNSTGSQNVALGTNTGYTVSGANNTLLGSGVGGTSGTFSGDSNIIVGAHSGGITTGSNNIIIGNSIKNLLSPTVSNQLNIGNLVFATDLSSGSTLSTGNVGIGTTTPSRALQVNGGGRFMEELDLYADTDGRSVLRSDATKNNQTLALESLGTNSNIELQSTIYQNFLISGNIANGSFNFNIDGSKIYINKGGVTFGKATSDSKVHLSGAGGDYANDQGKDVEFYTGGASGANTAIDLWGGNLVFGLGRGHGTGTLPGITFRTRVGTPRGTDHTELNLLILKENVAAFNGNVGIGTTSPAQSLEIYGVTKIQHKLDGTSPTRHVNLNLLETTGDPNLYIGRDNTGGGTGYPWSNIYIGGGNGHQGKYWLHLNGTAQANVPFVINQPASTSAINASGGFLRLTRNQGTNNFAFGTDANERGWIQNWYNSSYFDLLLNPNGGNVGIGTTDPTVKLHVIEAAMATAFKVDQANGTRVLTFGSTGLQNTSTMSTAGAWAGAADAEFYGGSPSRNIVMAKGRSDQVADIVQFKKSDNSVLLNVSASGNVGIGTTSPTELLQVGASNVVSPTILFYGNESSGSSEIRFATRSNNTTFSASIFSTGDPEYISIGGRANSTALKSSMNIFRDGSGAVVPNNGGPASFKILGSGNANSASLFLGSPNNDSAKNSRIVFSGVAASEGKAAIFFTPDGSGFNRGSIDIDTDNSANSSTISLPNGNGIRITSAGNVGIGTSNPDRILAINGNVQAGLIDFISTGGYGGTRGIFLPSLARVGVGNQSVLAFDGAYAEFGKGPNYIALMNGNVGIGTTTPASILHLFDGSVSPTVTIAAYTGPTNTATTPTVNFTSGGYYPTYSAGQIRVTADPTPFTGGSTMTFQVSAPGGSISNSWVVGGDGSLKQKAGAWNAIGTSGITFDSAGSSDRILQIGQQAGTGLAGQNLKIKAGDGNSGGNSAGGSVFLYGGTPNGSGISGNVILAHNGTSGLGKVGIGTSNPNYKLDVSGAAQIAGDAMVRASGNANLTVKTAAAAGVQLYASDTEARLQFNDPTLNQIRAHGSANLEFFINNGTAKHVMTPAGNVGIGTTSPGYALEVYSTVSGISSRAANPTNLGFVQALNNSGKLTAIRTTGSAYPAAPGANMGQLYSDASNGLAIQTNSAPIIFDTGAVTETMRLLSNGNVGIGTTDPNQKLTVNGNVGLINAASVASPVAYTSSIATGEPAIISYYQAQNYPAAGNYTRLLDFVAPSGSGGYKSAMRFITNKGSGPTESMIIDNSGNVGIGTPTPSASLHVLGSGGVDQFRVSPYFSSGGKSLWVDSGGVTYDSHHVATTKMQIGLTAYDATKSQTLWVEGNVKVIGRLNLGIPNNTSNYIEYASDYFDVNGGSGVRLYSNNTERLRVGLDGNVGIGTTAPGDTLDIAGNFRLNTNSTGGPKLRFFSNTDTTNREVGYMAFSWSPVTDVSRVGTVSLYGYDFNGNAQPLWIGSATSGGGRSTLYAGNSSNVNVSIAANSAFNVVNGSDNIFMAYHLNTDGYVSVNSSQKDYDFYVYGTTATPLLKADAGLGFVGIGTTTPGSRLSVSGGGAIGASYASTAVSDGVLIVSGNIGIGYNGASSFAAPLQFANGDGVKIILGQNQFGIGVNQAGPYYSMDLFANRAIGFRSSSITGALGASIGVNGAADSYFNASGGNVGIGTITPAASLHVLSTAGIQQNDSEGSAQLLVGGDGLFAGGPHGWNGSNLSYNGPDYVSNTCGGGGVICLPNQVSLFSWSGVSNGILIGTQFWSWAPVKIAANGYERLRVNSDGNVGIGTTGAAFPLDVSGNVRIGASGSSGALYFPVTTSGFTPNISSSYGGNSLRIGFNTPYLDLNGSSGLVLVSGINGSTYNSSHTGGFHAFQINGNDVMRLIGGAVGIGITNLA